MTLKEIVKNLMFLDDLNDIQLAAVKQLTGPVRIIAGPGSGKTKTIISKVINLLEHESVNPKRILIITFTNKAANEIRERINKQTNSSSLNIFTYHGFAAHFLRIEHQYLTEFTKEYQIIDRDDQKKIVNLVSKELKEERENEAEKVEFAYVAARFDKYAFNQSLINADKNSFDNTHQTISLLYQKYVQQKRSRNLLDFNDLLLEVNKLLLENPELAKKWTDKYDYLFVDELQDTNKIQYQILRSITTPTSNITVVGDPDQNIYSWRGASIEIILNFEKDYQNVQTFILNKNYRSTPEILSAANNLILHNKNRIIFKNLPQKPSGRHIKVFKAYSKQEEARLIINEIQRLHREQNLPYEEMAIIYRANFVSAEFENELLVRGINYILVGGFKFFERSEIKETLHFLNFLINKNQWALENIINLPARGIGEKTIQKFKVNSETAKQTIFDYLVTNYEKQSSNLKQFLTITNEADKKLLKSPHLVLEILKQFLEAIGYFDYIKAFEDKYENILNLLDQLTNNFELKNLANLKDNETILMHLRTKLDEFLKNAALQSRSDIKSQKNYLTLITAHAAKGTEYSAVFFARVNEKVIPSYRSQRPSEIEEERRVAYVAITRAKDYLYLSYSTGPNYDQSPMKPSLFIEEIIGYNNHHFRFNRSQNITNFDEYQNSQTLQSTSKQEIYSINDLVKHNKFGEGVIIHENEQFLTVAFSKPFGVKELEKNHSSYVKLYKK